VPAVYLSHILNMPIIDEDIINEGTLVIDDIADTGETLEIFDDFIKATLYYHKESTIEPEIWIFQKKDKWIVFPWEVDKCETGLCKPNTNEGIKKWKERFGNGNE